MCSRRRRRNAAQPDAANSVREAGWHCYDPPRERAGVLRSIPRIRETGNLRRGLEERVLDWDSFETHRRALELHPSYTRSRKDGGIVITSAVPCAVDLECDSLHNRG